MKFNLSALSIFIWLVALESAAALFYFLNIPVDQKNVWLFGLSRSRLPIIFGLLLLEICLIGLGLILWRKPDLSRQILIRSSKLGNKRGFIWGVLVFLEILVIFGGLFLIQWYFLSTNTQIVAYLTRLTPLVLLSVVVCIQGIILLWLKVFKDQNNRWLFILTILGGVVLFQWLLVAEFFIANSMFPEYYVKERYSELLYDWMPFILFQTAVFFQLPYLIKRKIDIKINYGVIGAIVALVIAYFYYTASLDHAQEINTNLLLSDQDVYVEFTRQVSISGFTYTGDRNQTPGYPFLQAIFCSGNLDNQELFMCGKHANIILSLAYLLSLFFIFRIFLEPHPSIVLLFLIAYSIFIFKAGYMTVELSFYFFSFISFILMSLMIKKPSIILGVLTGVTLGLSHLLKASVLPGIILFTFLFFLKIVWNSYLRKDVKACQNLKASLICIFLTIICFIIVIYPYIRQSKEIYGQYFYNVNSNFYIWYDSWGQAKQAEQIYHFKEGWPDIPASQRPSPQKYIRDHSISQIYSRIKLGITKQFTHLWDQYNTFNYLILYSLITFIFLIANLKTVKNLFRKYFFLSIFVTLYFAGYIILFGWYYPIAGGPRFIGGLYTPMIFSIFIILKNLSASGNSFRIFGHKINFLSTFNVINVFVLGLLLADIFIIITDLLPNGYFGS